SRTIRHASARKSITVSIRSGETIGECLQKCHDLVLLLIRQAEVTGGHVYVVPHFWHRPAVYLFDRPIRPMSGSDIVRIYIARVVEVDELLQTFDVAVVKELLLEIAYILAVHD